MTQATAAEHAEEVATADPLEDNRNEEIEQSPVPDPEAKDTGAGDDPQAD